MRFELISIVKVNLQSVKCILNLLGGTEAAHRQIGCPKELFVIHRLQQPLIYPLHVVLQWQQRLGLLHREVGCVQVKKVSWRVRHQRLYIQLRGLLKDWWVTSTRDERRFSLREVWFQSSWAHLVTRQKLNGLGWSGLEGARSAFIERCGFLFFVREYRNFDFAEGCHVLEVKIHTGNFAV